MASPTRFYHNLALTLFLYSIKEPWRFVSIIIILNITSGCVRGNCLELLLEWEVLWKYYSKATKTQLRPLIKWQKHRYLLPTRSMLTQSMCPGPFDASSRFLDSIPILISPPLPAVDIWRTRLLHFVYTLLHDHLVECKQHTQPDAASPECVSLRTSVWCFWKFWECEVYEIRKQAKAMWRTNQTALTANYRRVSSRVQSSLPQWKFSHDIWIQDYVVA